MITIISLHIRHTVDFHAVLVILSIPPAKN
jgi:hypothetical protein